MQMTIVELFRQWTFSEVWCVQTDDDEQKRENLGKPILFASWNLAETALRRRLLKSPNLLKLRILAPWNFNLQKSSSGLFLQVYRLMPCANILIRGSSRTVTLNFRLLKRAPSLVLKMWGLNCRIRTYSINDSCSFMNCIIFTEFKCGAHVLQSVSYSV